MNNNILNFMNIKKYFLNKYTKYVLFILVITLLLFLIKFSSIKFYDIELIDENGIAQNIKLPYNSRSNENKKYIYKGKIKKSLISRRLIKIIPDDCVKYIKINNVYVDLSNINHNKLCDWQHGFDFSPNLKTGSNDFEISIHDHGGIYGLNLKNSLNDPLLIILIVLLVIVISALICFCLIKFFRLTKLSAFIFLIKKILLNKYMIMISIFIISLFIYSFSNINRLTSPQGFQHYNYLAKSFLKGRLHIPNPPTNQDLSKYNGKFYVPFPSLPAIIIMPFVFIWGVKFRVAFIMVLLGALNTILVFRLLKKINSNLYINILLTIAFAFGTVHWWSTIREGVWFMAHIFSVFFLLFALNESVHKKRAYIMALFLGCSFLCRQLTIFAAPYFLWIILQNNINSINYKNLIKSAIKENRKPLIIFCLVLSFFVLQCLIYNFLRFGNILDSGYHYLAQKDQFEKYGLFSIFYLPKNLYYFIFSAPIFQPNYPFIKFHGDGLALIFTSPFLFFAIKSNLKLTFHIWIACFLIFIPVLHYFNTGFYQFGYRFFLDILPLVMLLLGKIVYSKKETFFLTLVVIYSIFINFLGVQFA